MGSTPLGPLILCPATGRLHLEYELAGYPRLTVPAGLDDLNAGTVHRQRKRREEREKDEDGAPGGGAGG